MILPDHCLRLVSPADRAKLGLVTAEEAAAKQVARSERELQRDIAQYLRLHDLWFDCDSMAKKRTGTKGAGDFQFPYKGRFVMWECKVDANKLTPDQCAVRDKVVLQGGQWRLIRSVSDAQAHFREMDLLC